MGYKKYVKEAWKKPKEENPELWKKRLIKWRREQATKKISNPTRPDRAKELGYKNKSGFVLIRQRVKKGEHMREKLKAGRRPKNYHRHKVLSQNYRQIAEQRAAKKHHNLVVLNSYKLAEDGKHKWYEVIMVDPDNPVVENDDEINWVTEETNQSRSKQGKTSAARKAQGKQN